METAQPMIEVSLRIPANWADPSELFERMPRDYRLVSIKDLAKRN